MLDAEGDFLNTGAPRRQDPSTGFFSTPNVTIIHKSLQELCDWLPCDSLSSDHRPITITLNLSDEQLKEQNDWSGIERKAIFQPSPTRLKARYLRSARTKKRRWTKCMRAILLKAAQKTHWDESGGNGWTVLDEERDQRQVEGARIGPSKRRHPHQSI